ncbi:hypothetical protein LSTR_LSTR002607 [Laodelphax striatellus]|uniref:Uncharacterized protein n=1 Tax=Laodelphax striatellus TaxID=195883 RepID=A0A482XM37_LAOST|nr:hypothetical protein LSTR_LSTR002607 [Laodelphax striatellus]
MDFVAALPPDGRRIALKNNWERGIFKKHYLEHDSPIEYKSFNVIVYPSKEPLDSYYYPFLMKEKGTQDKFGLYMICIDATNLKMSSELLLENDIRSTIMCACVMKNYVVWVHYNGEVQRFDAKCKSENRLKTVGTIKESPKSSDPDRNEYPRFLAMDDNHIVAATYVCLKVWCKQTHQLKLERSVPTKSSHCCSFHDGCLVISTTSPNKIHEYNTSRIEIYNLRKNNNISLQHELFVDGEVNAVECDENSIVYTYEGSLKQIFVRDRKTFAVKFSHSIDTYFSLIKISNELIIFDYFFKKFALNFSTCEFYKSKTSESQIYTVFDNLSVACYKNEVDSDSPIVDVWDWNKNSFLYRLNEGNPSEKFIISSVSESMIVAIESETGNLIIYKFD